MCVEYVLKGKNPNILRIPSEQALLKFRIDMNQYCARNLRQRLSPKAQPWDSVNTGYEKRQPRLSASLARVVMLIPSRDSLQSC